MERGIEGREKKENFKPLIFILGDLCIDLLAMAFYFWWGGGGGGGGRCLLFFGYFVWKFLKFLFYFITEDFWT